MIYKLFSLLLIGQLLDFGQAQYVYPQGNQGYNLPALQGLMNLGQTIPGQLQRYAQSIPNYIPPLSNLFGNQNNYPFVSNPYSGPHNNQYPPYNNNPSSFTQIPGINQDKFGQNQGFEPPNIYGEVIDPSNSQRNRNQIPNVKGQFLQNPDQFTGQNYKNPEQYPSTPFSPNIPGIYPQYDQNPYENPLTKLWNTVDPMNSILHPKGMLNPARNLNKIGEYAHKVIDTEADLKKEGINVMDRLARASIQNGVGVTKHVVGKLQDAFQDTMDTIDNFRGRNNSDDEDEGDNNQNVDENAEGKINEEGKQKDNLKDEQEDEDDTKNDKKKKDDKDNVQKHQDKNVEDEGKLKDDQKKGQKEPKK